MSQSEWKAQTCLIFGEHEPLDDLFDLHSLISLDATYESIQSTSALASPPNLSHLASNEFNFNFEYHKQISNDLQQQHLFNNISLHKFLATDELTVNLEQLSNTSSELGPLVGLDNSQTSTDLSGVFDSDQLGQIISLVDEFIQDESQANVTATDNASVSTPTSSSWVDGLEDDDEFTSNNSLTSSSESTALVKLSRPVRRLQNATMERLCKRESNKQASNRYRSKKMRERDQLFAEHKLYAAKNGEMRAKIAELQSEIDFIKNLLVQALLTKNNIKL